MEIFTYINLILQSYFREKMVIGVRLSKAPFLKDITALPLETVPSGKMRIGQTESSVTLLNSQTLFLMASITPNLPLSAFLSTYKDFEYQAIELRTQIFLTSAFASAECFLKHDPKYVKSNQLTWLEMVMGAVIFQLGSNS